MNHYGRCASICIVVCGDCAAVSLTWLLLQTWKSLSKSISPRPTKRSSSSTVSWSCRDSLTCLIHDRVCLYVHCLRLSYLTLREPLWEGQGGQRGYQGLTLHWNGQCVFTPPLLHSLSMYYVTLFPNLVV